MHRTKKQINFDSHVHSHPKQHSKLRLRQMKMIARIRRIRNRLLEKRKQLKEKIEEIHTEIKHRKTERKTLVNRCKGHLTVLHGLPRKLKISQRRRRWRRFRVLRRKMLLTRAIYTQDMGQMERVKSDIGKLKITERKLKRLRRSIRLPPLPHFYRPKAKPERAIPRGESEERAKKPHKKKQRRRSSGRRRHKSVIPDFVEHKHEKRPRKGRKVYVTNGKVYKKYVVPNHYTLDTLLESDAQLLHSSPFAAFSMPMSPFSRTVYPGVYEDKSGEASVRSSARASVSSPVGASGRTSARASIRAPVVTSVRKSFRTAGRTSVRAPVDTSVRSSSKRQAKKGPGAVPVGAYRRASVPKGKRSGNVVKVTKYTEPEVEQDKAKRQSEKLKVEANFSESAETVYASEIVDPTARLSLDATGKRFSKRATWQGSMQKVGRGVNYEPTYSKKKVLKADEDSIDSFTEFTRFVVPESKKVEALPASQRSPAKLQSRRVKGDKKRPSLTSPSLGTPARKRSEGSLERHQRFSAKTMDELRRYQELRGVQQSYDTQSDAASLMTLPLKAVSVHGVLQNRQLLDKLQSNVNLREYIKEMEEREKAARKLALKNAKKGRLPQRSISFTRTVKRGGSVISVHGQAADEEATENDDDWKPPEDDDTDVFANQPETKLYLKLLNIMPTKMDYPAAPKAGPKGESRGLKVAVHLDETPSDQSLKISKLMQLRPSRRAYDNMVNANYRRSKSAPPQTGDGKWVETRSGHPCGGLCGMPCCQPGATSPPLQSCRFSPGNQQAASEFKLL